MTRFALPTNLSRERGSTRFILASRPRSGLELVSDLLLEVLKVGEALEQLSVGDLDVYLEGIHVVLLSEDNLILRSDLGDADENRLDLRREDVDTLDLEHIVASAERLVHSRVGASAFALLIVNPGDVLRAVSEKRYAFLRECRDDKLALLAARTSRRFSSRD